MILNSRKLWRESNSATLKSWIENHAGTRPCPMCGDVGILSKNGNTFQCVCAYLQEEAALYARFSSMTPALASLSIAHLRQNGDNRQWQSVLDAARALAWLAKNFDSTQWVLLSGARGCGKTHIMAAAYNRIPHSAIYTSAIYLKDRVFEAMGEETLNEYKRVLVDVPVLMLDDLGAENGSDFIKATISDVIMERYAHGRSRPTVISMNNLKVIEQPAYERVRDRLYDVDLIRYFPITAPSYRTRTN